MPRRDVPDREASLTSTVIETVIKWLAQSASFVSGVGIVAALSAGALPFEIAQTTSKLAYDKLSLLVFLFVLGFIVQIEMMYRLLARIADTADNRTRQLEEFFSAVVHETAKLANGQVLVLKDDRQSGVWSGFSGIYQAYNPTFGMDIEFCEDVLIYPERADLHARRYAAGGVTSAHYHLF